MIQKILMRFRSVSYTHLDVYKRQDLVILDDNAAKKTAKYLGLTVTGTLGVLVKAKRQGIIEEVRSLLSEMRQNGFYVSKTVESMVLEQAGE